MDPVNEEKPPKYETHTLFIHAVLRAPIGVSRDELYDIITNALKEKDLRITGTFEIKRR